VETVQTEAVNVVVAADETVLAVAIVGDGVEVLVERVIVDVICIVCSTTAVSIESWLEDPVEVTSHGFVVKCSNAAFVLLLSATVATTLLSIPHVELRVFQLAAAQSVLYQIHSEMQ
jgi:hypothetical protein